LRYRYDFSRVLARSENFIEYARIIFIIKRHWSDRYDGNQCTDAGATPDYSVSLPDRHEPAPVKTRQRPTVNIVLGIIGNFLVLWA